MAEMEAERPDQGALEAELLTLGQASVVNVWYDSEGRPVDAWRNHFAFEYVEGLRGCYAVCSSWGPDGIGGTKDALEFREKVWSR